MSVFISYSHADATFVDRLAKDLIRNREHVWLDRWELNVGDSLILKIQKAMRDSDALLVVLSRASVESAWCQKELAVGLSRELKEKRVVVLPLLLDDCEIPPFLSDKMYADFRTDYPKGLKGVLDGLAAATNPSQNRFETEHSVMDWSFDWGSEPTTDHYVVGATIADVQKSYPMTISTRITILYDDVGTRRRNLLAAEGLEWYEHQLVTEIVHELADSEQLDVEIDDTLEHAQVAIIEDTFGASYSVAVSARRLGADPGKSTLVHLSNYLKAMREWRSSATRQLTPDETAKVDRILDEFRKHK